MNTTPSTTTLVQYASSATTSSGSTEKPTNDGSAVPVQYLPQDSQERTQWIFFQMLRERKITDKKMATYITEREMLDAPLQRGMTSPGSNELEVKYAINMVAFDNNLEALSTLLELGANPDVMTHGKTTLHLLLDKLLAEEDNKEVHVNTLLDSLKIFKKHNAQINTGCVLTGTTPLMLAVMIMDIKLVNALLDMKANVNARNRYSETPLSIACNHSDAKRDVIAALIRAGATVSAGAMGKKKTALHLIAENSSNKSSQLDIAGLLLHSGANPNQQDSERRTALHYAAKNRNEELIKLLRRSGAKSITDKNSKYPLDLFEKGQLTAEIYRQRRKELEVWLHSAQTLRDISILPARTQLHKWGMLNNLDSLEYPKILKGRLMFIP